MRSYAPKEGYSAMHVKSWCLDEEVYIGGSYNFTHNAESSNEEHLVATRDDAAVATYKSWFVGIWSRAALIDREEVEKREQLSCSRRPQGRGGARPSGGEQMEA